MLSCGCGPGESGSSASSARHKFISPSVSVLFSVLRSGRGLYAPAGTGWTWARTGWTWARTGWTWARTGWTWVRTVWLGSGSLGTASWNTSSSESTRLITSPRSSSILLGTPATHEGTAASRLPPDNNNQNNNNTDDMGSIVTKLTQSHFL